MTIVYVLTTYDGYGADKSAILNISYLIQTGKYNIICVSAGEGRSTHQLRELKIPIIILPILSWFDGYKWPSFRFLKKAVKIVFNRLLSIIALIFVFKHKTGNNVIVLTNTFTTDFGLRLAYAGGFKSVIHVRELPEQQFNFQYIFNKEYITRVICKTNTHVWVNSKKTSNYITNKFKLNGSIVPNPIFKKRIKSTEKVRTKNQLVFGFVGRMSAEKGIWEVILSFEKICDRIRGNAKLLVCGDGVQRDEIQKYIVEKELSDLIVLNNYVENIQAILCEIDVGLVASKEEAFGRIVIEYFSYSIPVIGHCSGNLPELIDHGKSGFLYNDQDTLAEKMLGYVLDKDLVNEQSQFIDNLDIEQYSYAKSAGHVAELLEQL